MLEGSQAAAQFIDSLIDSQLQGTEIEPDVRKKLHDNLRERLENKIIHAILTLLDNHQQRELEHLIDTDQTEKIEGYLTEQGVNSQQVIAATMAEFQASYLGA